LIYGKIYIAENIYNNKVYIGQTIRSIKNRMKAHLREYRRLQMEYEKNEKDYNDDLFCIHYANDPDSFLVDVLEDNIPIDILTSRENYWIDNYDSINNGYNIIKSTKQNLNIKKNTQQIKNYHFKDEEFPNCEKCMENYDFTTGEHANNWYCNECYLVNRNVI